MHRRINRQSWQQEASDRDSWRSSVRKASSKFEKEKHEIIKERRRRQKERAASLSSLFQTFICPKCSRVCTSRIGLSTATNEHARTDHQSSQKSSSAKNQSSSSVGSSTPANVKCLWWDEASGEVIVVCGSTTADVKRLWWDDVDDELRVMSCSKAADVKHLWWDDVDDIVRIAGCGTPAPCLVLVGG